MWGRPDILWGLLALAIPVALHLLQLRRFKRVAFSNVAFLRDVQKETRSRH
ncbi:MAG: BatA domain-containing protein, partial [Flavobacteriales bacterium]